MGIKFKKHTELFTFYDGKGNLIRRETEVRFDPLTGETSRIIFDSGLKLTPPDYSLVAEKTSGKNCPFCSENIMQMTPLFPKEVVESGRIFQGEAILFPNLFPYSKHNGVVVFSGKHYVKLEEFTSPLIKNAFMAAQTYIKNVTKSDPETKYASINWNYLPHSGGSILHPHLHVIVSDSPTNYQANVHQSGHAFYNDTGKEYFTELCNIEKENEERWIGEKGRVAWMHAYAPKGHNDFLGIFNHVNNLYEITEQDWSDFADGLLNLFKTLKSQNFSSFNLLFQLSIDPNMKQPVHVRLIPRFTIGGLDTSDINYFQALHQEPLSYKKPEEVAAIAREFFNK